MPTEAEKKAITAKYQGIRNQLRSKYEADRKALETSRSEDIKALQTAHDASVKGLHDAWYLEMAESYDNEKEEKHEPGTEAGQR